ncbi:putative 39S ribosomal protein L45-like protein [Leptotrombidium deliense]|uniref:Density-regulated protein homolog n=1 Tax=Leptotrombidium deliense TaxID=299467 RepID=A0A443SBN1_9ACAR|nr:putative 39S ribosomal protein L45-like protein [Leptotrombidium deliense]
MSEESSEIKDDAVVEQIQTLNLNDDKEVPSKRNLVKNGFRDDVKYPLKVPYCGECGLPLEYCCFYPNYQKCKEWLEKNDPEAFEKLQTKDASKSDTGKDEEGKKSSRQKRGGKGLVKSKKKQSVDRHVGICRASRGKKKFVTVVTGLATFDIDLKDAAKFFAGKFACGSSVTGTDEIVIQGDVKDDLFDIICEKWPEIDEDVVEDLGKKHWLPGPVEDWKKGIYNYEYRRARGRKVAKITLPNFDEMRYDAKLTPEEMRTKLKEKGIVPHRTWNEKPLVIRTTGYVVDPYVPPEGDGKESILSKTGVSQSVDFLKKKGGSFLSLRKIRTYLYDFDVPSFAEEALDIYIKAHKALANENEEELHEYVTDTCYPEMVHNTEYKTVRWQFLKSIENPRLVRIRHLDLMSNMFAQITVRLHTQQILAVYDRFGRLMHGSEHVVKDVLEYVVFERQLSSEHGQWRLHKKIIPDWLPPRPPILKTFKVEDVHPDKEATTENEQKNESARKIHLRPVLRGCHLITDEVLKQLTEISEFSVGLCHIQIMHTSASLALNENWDPDVREDMEMFLSRLVPESTPFRHSCEGPDDMPAHIKACFLGSSLTIPITDGKLNLGTWQGIWLNEHRNRAGSRKVVVTINGALKNGA